MRAYLSVLQHKCACLGCGGIFRAYLGPYQTSEKEIFANIVNAKQRSLFSQSALSRLFRSDLNVFLEYTNSIF